LTEGFDNLQVMTVVTRGTRVRTETMRAIGRKIEKDIQIGYVPTYLPRLILHIKAKENSEIGAGGKSHIRSLTFADAVSQYGNKIDFSDLGFAYEKAAHNFEGQMRQNFVVLRDREETETSGWGGRGDVLVEQVELVEHHVEEEIKELHGTDKRMNRMDPESFKDVKCEKCSVKNDS
jgi:hypothetical protein